MSLPKTRMKVAGLYFEVLLRENENEYEVMDLAFKAIEKVKGIIEIDTSDVKVFEKLGFDVFT